MEVVMKLTEQHDGIMFLTNVPNAEETQHRTEEEWIDALGGYTDKPRMEYCEDLKRNDYLHSCSTRTQ